MKSDYDESKNTIKCDDCVAYAKGGGYHLYSSASYKIEEPAAAKMEASDITTWAGKGSTWMPKSIAAVLCKIRKGFDQPEKYNIEGSPMTLDYSYMCCNECTKLDGKMTPCMMSLRYSVFLRVQVLGLQDIHQRVLPEECLRS